jgi:BlaI family transcriptional regulator, penicillinase repressor
MPVKTPPRISDAEWEVMRVAWSRGSVTAQDVVEALRDHDWSPRTIKTLLNRLKTKGALSHEARGKAYVYRPAVRIEDCVRHESQSFLERVFGGAAAPLLAHFVKRARLTPQELDELKALLAEKGK